MKAKTQNTNATLSTRIIDFVYIGGFISLFTFTVMQILDAVALVSFFAATVLTTILIIENYY